MADNVPTENEVRRSKTFRYTKQTDKLLKDYVCKVLDTTNSRNQELRDKFDEIDRAYARYLTAQAKKDMVGMERYGKVACKTSLAPVVSPIVISQVQSMVAYLSEVYLSGYPIFPVVSTPSLRKEAEALEGIVQDHLVLSQSIPEMQLIFNYAARYNVLAWDTIWKPLSTYNPTKQVTDLDPSKTTVKVDFKHINAIRSINLRNAHWDRTTTLAKVSQEGAYAGYTEIWNRIKLKGFLNYLSNENKLTYALAVEEALKSSLNPVDWHEDPDISAYVTNDPNQDKNWDTFGGFATDVPNGLRQVPSNSEGVYCVTKLYMRMLPSDFAMSDVPNKNHVQIWVLYVVNREVVISCEPYTGPYDTFGMGFSPLIEDGLELQTQGYGEMAMPLQDAVTRLMNIRFQAANRALQDRALYNPEMIRAADINSPFMGSKIPVVPSALMNNSMDSAYKHIPFDGRGTENVLADAVTITDWQKELSGQNNASRGQFTKGNRTLGEFDSIMTNSDNRQRLPALVVEHRMMAPIKATLKLNILMYGEDTEVISPRTNEPIEVSIEKLQQKNLQFEVADGYTPKSKIANTDFLMAGMNMVAQSAPLQQTFGAQLPAMFAHIMTLGGVRGFDQYAQTATDEFAKSTQLQLNIQQLLQQLLASQAAPGAVQQAQQQDPGVQPQ